MGKLGKRFTEIGRGYEKVSVNYQRPYILGVDINDLEKPFVIASGDHHSDTSAVLISVNELLSYEWKDDIQKSNCLEFVDKLRKAVKKRGAIPPTFYKGNGKN